MRYTHSINPDDPNHLIFHAGSFLRAIHEDWVGVVHFHFPPWKLLLLDIVSLRCEYDEYNALHTGVPAATI